MRRGRLIAVEGLDGTGKTTLSRGLAARLDALWTTTPPADARPLRAVVDAWPEPARRLFYASSVVAVGLQVQTHLAAGRDVVVDRYWLSTRAYAAEALELACLEAQVPPADVTILLSLGDVERERRLRARGALSAADARSLVDGAGILAAYRRLAGSGVSGRFVEVDVEGLAPAESLARVLWRTGLVSEPRGDTRLGFVGG